jgi:hypothetical protein
MLNLPDIVHTVMVKFTFAEMAGVHLIYGAAVGNGKEAVHLNTEKFPVHW